MDLICRAHQVSSLSLSCPIVRGNRPRTFLQVVEDGYEFFAKRQLVTLFSAPNYCGEFDNAGGMMSVDETLMCSFQVRRLLQISFASFRLDSFCRFWNQVKRNRSISTVVWIQVDHWLLHVRRTHRQLLQLERKQQRKNKYQFFILICLFMWVSMGRSICLTVCLFVCVHIWKRWSPKKGQTRKLRLSLLVESFGSRKPMFTQCCFFALFLHFPSRIDQNQHPHACATEFFWSNLSFRYVLCSFIRCVVISVTFWRQMILLLLLLLLLLLIDLESHWNKAERECVCHPTSDMTDWNSILHSYSSTRKINPQDQSWLFVC